MEDFEDVAMDPAAPAWSGLPGWRPPAWERQRQRQQQQGGAAGGGAGASAHDRRRMPDVLDIMAGLGDGMVDSGDESAGGEERDQEEERGGDGWGQGHAGSDSGAGSDEDALDGGGAPSQQQADSSNGDDSGGGGCGSDNEDDPTVGSDDDVRGWDGSAGSDQEEIYGGGAETEAAGAETGQGVDPEDLVEADFDLDRSGVLARVEGVIGDAVAALAEGRLPELEFVCRAAGNTHMVADEGEAHAGDASMHEGTMHGGDGGNSSGDEEGTGGGGRQGAAAGGRAAARVRLGARTHVKSMTKAQGRQAHTVARVFEVLAAVHELLRTGRQTTQRDIYYKLAGPPLFPNASAVNTAISDTVALLRVPRSRLGITCSPRGAATGPLHVRDGAAGAWVDCGALGPAGWAVPGDLAAVERLGIRVNARFILAVEKDAIFQRLAADGLPAALSAVLITAKGFPDLATRAFLCRVCAAAPQATVLGLVDWNPAGAVILATFKFGNARMGLEGSRYAVPRLRWLGVTGGMLGDVPRSAFKPLTARDRGLAAGLRGRLVGQRGWLEELGLMEERGLKCDIEALYAVGGFEGLRQLVTRRVLQGQYL